MKYYTFLEIIADRLYARYDKIQIIFDFDYQITNDSKIIIKNREYEFNKKDFIIMSFKDNDIIERNFKYIKIKHCIIYNKWYDFKFRENSIKIKYDEDSDLCPYFKMRKNKIKFYFNKWCYTSLSQNIESLNNTIHLCNINNMKDIQNQNILFNLKKFLDQHELDYHISFSINAIQRINIINQYKNVFLNNNLRFDIIWVDHEDKHHIRNISCSELKNYLGKFKYIILLNNNVTKINNKNKIEFTDIKHNILNLIYINNDEDMKKILKNIIKEELKN